MNGCATKLDGNFWIENAYSGLERFEGVILVRKDTKYAGFDTKANACRNVFLCGLEPGVALGLDGRSGAVKNPFAATEQQMGTTRGRRWGGLERVEYGAYLLEDVVEDGVVAGGSE